MKTLYNRSISSVPKCDTLILNTLALLIVFSKAKNPKTQKALKRLLARHSKMFLGHFLFSPSETATAPPTSTFRPKALKQKSSK